jgi:hypothetical protein
MYIFVDESGDLGTEKGTKYFVIGMVFYYGKDMSPINRVINVQNEHLWNNGWPKDAEIKATNLYNYMSPRYDINRSKLQTNPRSNLRKIYKEINNLNLKAGFLIHVPSNQGPGLRCLHKERIYNYLSKVLYTECFSFLNSPMNIFVDQRNITLVRKQKNVNLNIQRLNLDYIGYIRNEISFQYGEKKRINPTIEISFEKSEQNKGIQIADYLIWAVRKKYEGKSQWYDLLGGIEMIEKKDNF